jgi:rhodanese-related sulfurtransferase
MKKLIKEILLITGTAVLIAFAYNMFSPKPLSWIYKPREIAVVHDTELIIESQPIESATSDRTIPDTAIDTMSMETETASETVADTQQISNDIDGISATKEEKPNKMDYDILKTLKYEQVVENMNNPDFLLVDARHKEEWEKAHIGNAINITPPYEGELDVYFKKLSVLPHNKIIVVYCTGGSCEASHRVATDLRAISYEHVFLYSGGWDDWTKMRGK